MTTNSIFGRQWWAVALRLPRRITPNDSAQDRLETLAGEIASIFGGGLQTRTTTAKRGVVMAARDKRAVPEVDKEVSTSVVMLQTDRVFFPLAPEDLETGPLTWKSTGTSERDFPRRLTDGRTTIFQYPLLLSCGRVSKTEAVYVISSPYFMLLRQLMDGLRRGKLFSACLGVDVGKVFDTLHDVTLPNGTLTVRSGRMLITGIDFLRSAVFFGENVVLSPLYTQLTAMKNVSVNPKDCRLRRNYVEPVGADRRPFVCWFDQHGNYRFTPGTGSASAVRKLLDLIAILMEWELLRDAELSNPLSRIGLSPQLS